ncbi:gephyrin-like molybdotransferase Glp [Oceanisphaera psychrotolerans]|uniref:Molybdopterin molybdenumtransferase n=1 Tax=Oceanisphaera psychrotolerans TaxID=1414654 RepID=A0A1J4QAY1_9GAMM|nr:gephyrin-like molybdotransferase Glp [Oceanisphaera psychrotolerans]OIN06057.1 molybdopterin molybdenumtransferase MoeA [Oceanisphaera psychrotolerans]
MAIHDCDSQPGLRPYLDAKHDMLTRLDAITDNEPVSLDQSLNRILADDIYSPIDVPSFANSAMDGYALRATDAVTDAALTLIGTSLAGHPFNGRVGPGECVRIMTGAALPLGADAVVMQENCRSEHNIIYPRGAVTEGQNIRQPAEDLAQGERVFAAGTRINARVLSVLSSLGLEQLYVRRPLKVALLSTGDELKSPGELLAPGDIYDSNRIGIGAMLERLGIRVIDYGIIKDDPALIRQAFLKAASEADALITSGGVSVGDADYTKQVLEDVGRIGFWKLAVKPGKPFAFGHISDSPFFGLPGNPVSAAVTFHLLVRPALAKLAGETLKPTPLLQAKALMPLRKSPGRMDFQRGMVSTQADGSLGVVAAGSQSSAVYSAMAEANCLLHLEQDRGNVAEGEMVTLELIDGLYW